jgi:hypothetical protein
MTLPSTGISLGFPNVLNMTAFVLVVFGRIAVGSLYYFYWFILIILK